MKPTLCLNMIVKNESHIIETTLKNLMHYFTFDYWVICDTGSTDNTQTIIQNFFNAHQIKGELHHHEWRDFGHNRSIALQCAFNKTDYLLIFDADDSIHGEFSLPTPLNADSYMLQFGPGCSYSRPLLITNRKKWKFRGVLHEYLDAIDPMGPQVTVLGNYYVESGRSGNRNLQSDKYYKDAIVLAKAYHEEPPDGIKARYAFYCAQSYRDAGEKYRDQAIEWYKKVLEYKHHWNQEHYYACFQIGNLYKDKNLMDHAITYYTKSVEYDSERVEGIVSAMHHFHHLNYYALNNSIYQRFKNYASHPLHNKLFVNMYYYNDRIEFYNLLSACHVNDHASGYQCCKHVMQHKRLDNNDLTIVIQQIWQPYKAQLDSDKDTLLLFHQVNTMQQPWHPIVLEVWKYLFEKNREKLTTVTPPMVQTMQTVASNALQKSAEGQDKIIITFTTCKRLALFKETIHSILLHWKDLDAITHWFCVDDNSNTHDRMYMQQHYPWIQFYMKSESEKGHLKSMNIIWDKLQELQPKYWVHMEDDFLFYHPMQYIKPYLSILSANDYNIKQIVYNRNYAETVDDFKIQGHLPTSLPSIVLHNHHMNPTGYNNCHYWPHYSFRPSICLVEPILQLGRFDGASTFFEKEYAHKWNDANYKTAFYDGITHRHIGRLTSEIGKVKNAYDLNQESQFGNHPYLKVINLDRRRDRKKHIQEQFLPYSIQPTWVSAVDGLALQPSAELKHLFRGNDFGSKRGVVGCALSHYGLWQQLVADPVHDYYIIMEDDITLCDQFKQKVDRVLQTPITAPIDILFLGYHMFSSKRDQVKDVYDCVSEVSTIHPLQNDLYIGGFFAYMIHKTGAKKALAYIQQHGIQHGIDYVVKKIPNFYMSEVHPFLVHSPWLEYASKPIDTDIQLCTTNLFSIYDQFEFVQGQDHIGNDMEYKKEPIETMLLNALNSEKCVAVNTLGFYKDQIGPLTSSPYFKENDGIYIKKNKLFLKKNRVKMLCNWCSSEQLCKEWSNMYDPKSKFVMTSENTDIDYYVVINSTHEFYDPSKTIVFQMEPWVHGTSPWGVKTWGKWAIPDPSTFLEVRGRKTNCHNNVLWQLEQTYTDLQNLTYAPKLDRISTICSSKYFDPGHIARVELLRFLETRDPAMVDIYNKDNDLNFTNYKGPCTPYVDKSKGILPYKYYFMVENNYEDHFITEKLWEPILCESLCFYFGCPNVSTYIDQRAFVALPIHDFEACYQIMQTALAEDWWAQRLPIIQQEKQKILQELSFCPVVNEIIQRDKKLK